MGVFSGFRHVNIYIFLFFYKFVTNYHIVRTTKANNRHIKKFGKNNVLICPVQEIKVWKHMSVIMKKNRFLSFVVLCVGLAYVSS